MLSKRQVFRASALALACALALGAQESAQAVSVNPRGLGQVLLYPYYTIDGGQQTLLTVTNTTDSAKAVSVRFREALNGRSTYQFILYLGAHDVWVGVVTGATAGPAVLVSGDASCTAPRFDAPTIAIFRNYQFTGANRDDASGALERTRVGYIEMIEIGTLQRGPGALQLAEEASVDGGGRHSNCDAFIRAWTPGAFSGNWAENPAQNIDLPTGGLTGDGQMVDVVGGTVLMYRAVALADFYSNSAAPAALNRAPGSEHPDLRDADNGGGIANARLRRDDGSSSVETYQTGTADAASLAMLHSGVSNTFSFEAGLGASTDWVVTFPTKNFYTDLENSARAPFTDPFRGDGSSYEEISLNFYNREQASYVPLSGCATLCATGPTPRGFGAAANVLEIAAQQRTGTTSTLRASIGVNAISVGVTGFDRSSQSGWLNLKFYDPTTLAPEHVMVGPSTGIRYEGLPAIGFAAFQYINANAQPGLLANYAAAVVHAAAPPIESARAAGE